MEDDILQMVSRVAAEADRLGDERDILQLITFFKAKLIADFGGLIATTIAHKMAREDITAPVMSETAATVIEETGRCFELIALREWCKREM